MHYSYSERSSFVIFWERIYYSYHQCLQYVLSPLSVTKLTLDYLLYLLFNEKFLIGLVPNINNQIKLFRFEITCPLNYSLRNHNLAFFFSRFNFLMMFALTALSPLFVLFFLFLLFLLDIVHRF